MTTNLPADPALKRSLDALGKTVREHPYVKPGEATRGHTIRRGGATAAVA